MDVDIHADILHIANDVNYGSDSYIDQDPNIRDDATRTDGAHIAKCTHNGNGASGAGDTSDTEFAIDTNGTDSADRSNDVSKANGDCRTDGVNQRNDPNIENVLHSVDDADGTVGVNGTNGSDGTDAVDVIGAARDVGDNDSYDVMNYVSRVSNVYCLNSAKFETARTLEIWKSILVA